MWDKINVISLTNVGLNSRSSGQRGQKESTHIAK